MTATAPPVIDGVEWVRPAPTAADRRYDAVLAVVLFAGTLASSALYRTTGYGEDAPFWLTVLWSLAMTAPLAFRRRWPEVVAVVLSAAFIAGGIAQIGEALFSNITLFIAIYSVGAWGRSRRRATAVRAVIVAAMFVWLFWGLVIASNAPDLPPSLARETDGPLSPYVAFALINVLTNLLYFGGAWYFGDAAAASARSTAALRQRTDELAAERERSREQAVALERLRIARELHDVVAHHVSVIGVQAGAARRVLARDPEQAATSLSAIEESAREAVAELHGLLGTLRHGTGDEDAAAGAQAVDPAPRGLEDLPGLVEDSIASGVPASLTVIGEPRDASPVVQVTAYRLVQEALTNVRKHAGPGASAEVRLRWEPGALEVEVTDTGVAAARAEANGVPGSGGLGLIGMRERVSAVGGALEVGPRRRGGFLVRAGLPLRRTGEAS
ncbi:histidine kinase [Agromyces sp. G08B096]|uniref:histidine kinase n=1 Tax=Agromyces sp. G08B096 TaxID=3156399 RepID=A0AAU7WAT1_9MICO